MTCMWKRVFCKVTTRSFTPEICMHVYLARLLQVLCYVLTSYINQIVYGWMHVYLAIHFLHYYLCKCCLHLWFEWNIKEFINFSPSKSSRFYDRVFDTSLPKCLDICFYSLYNCWLCWVLLHITGGWKTFIIS